MKKRDLKKLASMGIACGVMLSAQANGAIDMNSSGTILAGESGSSSSYSYGGSTNYQANRNTSAAQNSYYPEYNQSSSCGSPSAAQGQWANSNSQTYYQSNRSSSCGSPMPAPGKYTADRNVTTSGNTQDALDVNTQTTPNKASSLNDSTDTRPNTGRTASTTLTETRTIQVKNGTNDNARETKGSPVAPK